MKFKIQYGQSRKKASEVQHSRMRLLNGGSHVTVYPSTALAEHMSKWEQVEVELDTTKDGKVKSFEVIKAEQGYRFRFGYKHQRPHFNFPTRDLVVEKLGGDNKCDGRIEGDAVVFTIPPSLKLTLMEVTNGR